MGSSTAARLNISPLTPITDVATKSDESHESNESRESCKGCKGHDGNSRVQVSGGIDWFEGEGCEGNDGALMGVAAAELKKVGSFKIARALNLKLKQKPATPARKGVNPFTKEPCVFKAKPASKTVKALPMKKLKELVN